MLQTNQSNKSEDKNPDLIVMEDDDEPEFVQQINEI